ncbi:MAG: hypothetical protein UW73_C0018G0029 [Microgenomates group bacterium GW2011_GWB1_44_8]|nr:MAG: hypothetical protein UW73_C0018G0029 [Microgenomates group bacterium GW2011_GWB1_44_8]
MISNSGGSIRTMAGLPDYLDEFFNSVIPEDEKAKQIMVRVLRAARYLSDTDKSEQLVANIELAAQRINQMIKGEMVPPAHGYLTKHFIKKVKEAKTAGTGEELFTNGFTPEVAQTVLGTILGLKGNDGQVAADIRRIFSLGDRATEFDAAKLLVFAYALSVLRIFPSDADRPGIFVIACRAVLDNIPAFTKTRGVVRKLVGDFIGMEHEVTDGIPI